MTDPKSPAPNAPSSASKPVSGTAPHSASAPEPAEVVHINESLSADEVKGMVGELKPGELGWVKLSLDGEPQGAATKDPPKEGPAARVFASTPRVTLDLTTPSGAPITEHMNPSLPQPYVDEGMAQRNPVPGSAQAASAPASDHSAGGASTSTSQSPQAQKPATHK